MIGFLLLLTGIPLLVVVSRLARLVRLDGRGVRPPPRSHLAELGTWIDRELGR